MSTFKQIRNKGIHQEDVVDLLDAITKQRVSILNFLSTLAYVVSLVFGDISDMAAGTATSTSLLSISMSGQLGNPAGTQSFGISTRTGGFPTSITALTTIKVTTV